MINKKDKEIITKVYKARLGKGNLLNLTESYENNFAAMKDALLDNPDYTDYGHVNFLAGYFATMVELSVYAPPSDPKFLPQKDENIVKDKVL